MPSTALQRLLQEPLQFSQPVEFTENLPCLLYSDLHFTYFTLYFHYNPSLHHEQKPHSGFTLIHTKLKKNNFSNSIFSDSSVVRHASSTTPQAHKMCSQGEFERNKTVLNFCQKIYMKLMVGNSALDHPPFIPITQQLALDHLKLETALDVPQHCAHLGANKQTNKITGFSQFPGGSHFRRGPEFLGFRAKLFGKGRLVTLSLPY